MRYYIFLVFIMFLFTYPIQTFAQKNCLSCHNNWYNAKIDESSIHSPFLHGNCNVCHSKTNMNNSLGQGYQINNYNWISSEDISSGISLIPLPQNKNLLIKIINEDEKINKIFHLAINDKVSETNINWALPIIISNFHVISITSDYMVHAKIAWQTNIPTKCTIYYGTSNDDENTSTEYLYSTNHILEIDGLKRNSQYYVYIMATSPVNETLKSPTVSFNTCEQFNNSNLMNNPNTNKKFDVKLVDIEGHKYIEVSTPVPLYLRIALDDSNELSVRSISSNENNENIAEINVKPTHLCSSEIYELGYKKCLSCHRSSQYDHNSHPINITLPPNMHPPKELLLVNSKIICITCHYPHASNYPHQLRTEETTLCGCCHDLRQYAGLKIAQQYQFRNHFSEVY